MATESAPAEDFTGNKYSLHTFAFRSIKRARDVFLVHHDQIPASDPEMCGAGIICLHCAN